MNDLSETVNGSETGGQLPPSDSQADRLLRLVHWTSAASRQLRRRLVDVGAAFELSDSELLVVWLCSGGGRIQGELATSIGVSPAQMSGMVERLRSRGLVAMHRSVADRRRQVWRATACGQTLLAHAARHLNELAASVGEDLSDEEQHVAQTLCERLAQVAMQKAVAAAILLAVCFGSTGCSRTFYRRQADLDAYALVREKATHPHWRLPNYSISVDPRSRMYDPYQIDAPPMPPDDPTAHQLMHCVDNKRGWPFWHDDGDRPFVENPAWPQYINIDERGVLKLSVDDAVRLALLNSRDYQQQLEVLYLSALDVSVERFAFDSQFFAGYQVGGEWLGRLRGNARETGVGGNSVSNFSASTFNNRGGGRGGGTNNWTLRKQFTTGSELVVNFANNLMWQFSGPDNYSPETLLDFSLVQPLLRNAGRDRVLETLTLFERVLLYNVRILEQYRQAFYVDTAVGGGTQNSTPSRRGGVQGQGAAGFQGVGGAGFGNVVTQGGQGGTQAAQGAQNFIGLLQQQRQIRNREDAIRRIRRNLEILTTTTQGRPQEQTAGYLSDLLQVAQTRQQLLQNETQLINQRNQYQQQLDQFKVNELSLPPQICVEPTDNRLDQFNLIGQEMISLQEDFGDLLLEHPESRREIPERIQNNVVASADPAPRCRLNRYPELPDDLAKLQATVVDIREYADRIANVHLVEIAKDLESFRQSAPRRRERLEKLATRIEELLQSPCELLPLGVHPLEAASGATVQEQISRLNDSLERAQKSYDDLSQKFTRYARSLGEREQILINLQQSMEQSPEELFEQLVRGVFSPLYICGETRVLTMDVVEDITRDLVELQLLQAVARTESIDLQEIDIRAEEALDVARKYRRDWMNRRAALVDQWRLLQFNADQLQAGLDVVFEGEIQNVGDSPFRLRPSTGRLAAGIQFDAPITRLSQRNAYRQSLIEYQQARRNYYNFEDSVGQQLRGQLRSITSFQINFEINRLAVLEAARQGLLNTFLTQEQQQSGVTSATAARDQGQAVQDLLTAQDNFMLVWISYEVQRLQLDFAMGTMQLNDEGLWIDPGRIGRDYGKFDPWAWRPGQEGAEGQGAEAGEMLPPGDKTIDHLPPPFLLPPANSAEPSPAVETVPPGTRIRGER
jgi:DNA-binding MarR family transcriptional regulator